MTVTVAAVVMMMGGWTLPECKSDFIIWILEQIQSSIQPLHIQGFVSPAPYMAEQLIKAPDQICQHFQIILILINNAALIINQ